MSADEIQERTILTAEQRLERFGDGPWLIEPDRIEWRSGDVPCLMVRQPDHGHWCGYVAVRPGHPWYQTEPDAEVHGGITYGDHCTEHVCHVPAPGEPDNVWWVGFDCSHSGDLSPGMLVSLKRAALSWEVYRDRAWVTAEVERLAQQAREHGEKHV